MPEKNDLQDRVTKYLERVSEWLEDRKLIPFAEKWTAKGTEAEDDDGGD